MSPEERLKYVAAIDRSSEASDINNEGYGAQVEYLLKFGHSVQAIAEATGLAPVDP